VMGHSKAVALRNQLNKTGIGQCEDGVRPGSPITIPDWEEQVMGYYREAPNTQKGIWRKSTPPSKNPFPVSLPTGSPRTTLSKMNPEPTRIELGGNIFEVRLNLIVKNLPVERETLLNTEQAAKFLSISSESLRRLVRRKVISYVTVLPSEYRFREKDLQEYLMSRWNRRRSGVR
jgi:excisionase family DNA binding protein